MEPPIRDFSRLSRYAILALASIALSAQSSNATPIQAHLNSTSGTSGAPPPPGPEEHGVPPGTPDYYFRLAVCAVLVLTGGLLAGLTLGLMSLDETNLHILATSGTETQRKYAQRIQPLRKNGHWLLVTLLLGNTVVNETLPIVMDSIFGGGVTAVVISTASIVLFGEIIPQSLCARYGLTIGAFFAYPVRILQLILSPLGYPIAMLLDYVLGADHGMTYKKAELKELVSLSDTAHGGNLSADEVTIIRGALELSEKMVADVMTDLSNVYMVDINARLNCKLLTEMLRRGHSRVPVYDGERVNIVGVLLVKSLILLDPDDCTPVSEAKITSIPLVTTDTSLYDILNAFQEGGSHMAMVMGPPPPQPPLAAEEPETTAKSAATSTSTLATSSTPLLLGLPQQQQQQQQSPRCTSCSPHRSPTPIIRRKSNYIVGGGGDTEHALSCHVSDDELRTYVPIGIITLEDVIEELIQEEIIDETDVFVDMRKRIKVVRATTQATHVASVRFPHSPGTRIAAADAEMHIPPLPLNPRSGDYDHLRKQHRGFAFSSRRRQEAQEEEETLANAVVRPQSFPSSSVSDEGAANVWAGSNSPPQLALLGETVDDSDSRSI